MFHNSSPDLAQYLLILSSYIAGSIPFGLIIGRIFTKTDIRKQGSGNIGATNAVRILGKKLGIVTFLLDGFKGGIMVIVAKLFFLDSPSSPLPFIVGFAAVMGHIFPIWLRFRGGKGVATTMVVLLALSFPVGLFACISWAVIFWLFKISALSSIFSILLTTLFTTYQSSIYMVILCFMLSIIIVAKHRSNIKRMLQKKENGF